MSLLGLLGDPGPLLLGARDLPLALLLLAAILLFAPPIGLLSHALQLGELPPVSFQRLLLALRRGAQPLELGLGGALFRAVLLLERLLLLEQLFSFLFELLELLFVALLLEGHLLPLPLLFFPPAARELLALFLELPELLLLALELHLLCAGLLGQAGAFGRDLGRLEQLLLALPAELLAQAVELLFLDAAFRFLLLLKREQRLFLGNHLGLSGLGLRLGLFHFRLLRRQRVLPW
mmetsp:Transcript_5453/g.15291  ORF Transcript_5453/g.15291 Transcript_5453/m.15291 type:complete len:235 (+) Transcript_5453:531-1235(+)